MIRSIFSALVKSAAAVCLAALLGSEAECAVVWNKALGGFWREAANWSGGVAPRIDMGSTFITNATTKTVTLDGLTPPINLLINALTIAAPAGATNTLRLADLGMNHPLALANNRLTVARGGALSISNSSLVVTGRFIDFNVWAGSVTLDSGSIIVREEPLTTNVTVVTRLARTNTASLTINGGLMDVTQLLIGESPGNQYARSHGVVKINGGMLSVAAEFSIGDGGMCMGIVDLVGGELRVANHQTNVMRIGNHGIGQLTVSNALASVGNVSVARHDASRGLLILQTNGLMICSDDLSVGRFSGATGLVLVAGGQLFVTNHPIWVGREGHGHLILSNGFVRAKGLHVTTVRTNTARGLVTLAGGTMLVSSNFVLGDVSRSTGEVTMTGGELFVTNARATAFLTALGGSFTLNGGVITADRIWVTNAAGSMHFNGGTLHSSGTVVSNGLPFTVGNGAQAATLHLDGGTHVFPDGLVISPNATLSGCGTIVGSIINHGTITTNCGASMTPPSITQQPASLTVTPEANVSFSVEAVGTAPLSYQWRLGRPGPNAGNIDGATGPVLKLNNVVAADAGPYHVVVTNSSGSVTSVVATLRVLLAPAIGPVSFSGNSFSLSFPSVNGLTYFLEFKDALDAPSWTPLGSAPGTGEVLLLMDAPVAVPIRFYRVRVE